MIRNIHYSKFLPKQLQGLRQTGKKAELAANKCEAILQDIRQYGCHCDAVLGKRTRYGELRIKNCVKYHLGSGYRLVTIKADCHLFICFVGNHEETNQWLESHRLLELDPGDPLYRCEERVFPLDNEKTNYCDDNSLDKSEDPYEDDLRARIDESLLKSIFQGLFANPALVSDKTDSSRDATP